MIYSNVTIYKSGFDKALNARIDNIEGFLSHIQDNIDFSRIVYNKATAKRELRIALDEYYSVERDLSQKFNGYDYCMFKNYVDDKLVSTFFYFIDKISWVANRTLKLDLSIDSINTLILSEDLSELLDKTTYVEREHRDRYSSESWISSSTTLHLVPQVDEINEGYSPTLYQTRKTEIDDDRVFMSDRAINWAIFYGHCWNDGIVTIEPSKTLWWKGNATSPEGTTFEVNGYLAGYENTDYTFTKAESKGELYKVIEVPYCPLEIRHSKEGFGLDEYYNMSLHDFDLNNITEQVSGLGWYKWREPKQPAHGEKPVFNAIKLYKWVNKSFNAKFNSDFWLDSFDTQDNIDFNAPRFLKDTKLKHSAFESHRFVYDTFSLDIPFERLKSSYHTEHLSVTLSIHVSTAMSSTFAFKVTPKDFTYSLTEDFPLIFYVTRNNEQLLINDAYLNYIRGGYNYDRKSRFVSATATLAGSAVTTALSLALAPATGGASVAISVASTIIGSISTAIQNEQSVQRNKETAKMQGYNVSGADDLGLMKDLQSDKLCYIVSRCSSVIYNQLDDLFYYYGYKTGYQKLPNVKTRLWFNFLQCNAKWKNGLDISQRELYEELFSKLREGVTFFHCVDGNMWNIARTKENWETSLVNKMKGNA